LTSYRSFRNAFPLVSTPIFLVPFSPE
jgi:hypothetical protein